MESIAWLLITLGVIFLAALVFDTIGRRTALPRVTLLILFGFVAGPSMLDVLPDITRVWFPVVADMALMMVGFLLGGRLTLQQLREHGGPVLRVSLVVVAVTGAVVGLGLAALGVPPVIAILLAAIATATDPAATVDVVHAAGAETPFSEMLLDIVTVDDGWGLIAFSGALAFANFVAGDGASSVLLHGAWELAGAVGLGLALGIPTALLSGRVEPGEPSLYEALGAVFLCGGVALLLDVSFLLASMTLGVVVGNLARHHRYPFHAIEGIEWPFMILFFVLAGASLDLGVLAHAGTWLAAYVALRFVGRLAGGWLGGSLPPADHTVRNFMGLALLPQAGVALGMALVATQAVPEAGAVILPLVVAATTLFEIVGPIATRVALKAAARSSPPGVRGEGA